MAVQRLSERLSVLLVLPRVIYQAVRVEACSGYTLTESQNTWCAETESDGRKNSTTPTILARSGRHQPRSWAEGINGWGGLFLTQILTQTCTDIWVKPSEAAE